MAKIATKKDRWLQTVKGCYQANLPYASVGAVRVTPSVDLVNGKASCLLEATTGTQKTKAVLNLEYDNPTLTVIHSLNERYAGVIIWFILQCEMDSIALKSMDVTVTYTVLSYTICTNVAVSISQLF